MSKTSFIIQFGDELLKPSQDGLKKNPSDAFAGKEYLMLYFSAHWCPPCRKFTPKLIELYNKLKTANKSVELVFCSLDRDKEQYKEYVSDMPWLCMPFNSLETKKLAQKYGARGIPHLVIVDASTGDVITKDGTSGVYEDEDGKNFPWKPKSFEEVWPEKILANKQKASHDKFLDSVDIKDKYLMLYFSAHWCPPCRGFTPKLTSAYTELNAERDDFELVFISSDNDVESFNEYFDTMSFCALPYENRDAKTALSKMFDVSGIPTLVMLGPVGETGNRPLINPNIRGFIEAGDFSDFPFAKKNYGDVNNSVEDINEIKSVILFHEYGDDEEQNEIKDIAKQVSIKVEEDKTFEGELNVLWVLSIGQIGKRIRELLKMPEQSSGPAMVILDIPDNGGAYKSDSADITVENVLKFIKNPGQRIQLG